VSKEDPYLEQAIKTQKGDIDISKVFSAANPFYTPS
jgi:hypothetical protein